MPLLEKPSLRDTAAALVDALGSGPTPARTITIAGRCRISYRGRAASELALGDRIVLLKQDGMFLIHAPTGVKPINWQPPGARFEVVGDEGRLVLFARRIRPAEVVEIVFESVQHFTADRLEDAASLDLSGSEFDLRDLLRSQPGLVEPGFQPWAKERLTDQGPMDLYGEDGQGRRVVVEVKRVRAGLEEATQLWRYVEAERKRRATPVRGILVAPQISPRALQLLEEHGLEFLERSWNDGPAREARERPGPRQGTLRGFGGPKQNDKS